MPCIPLLISSACFIVPAVIGFRKIHRKKDAIATSVLTATSLWFHGTRSTLSYIVDRTYAHVFAVYYVSRALVNQIRYKRLNDTIALTFALATVGCYAKESKLAPKQVDIPTHMALHLCSIIALSTHMLHPDYKKTSLPLHTDRLAPQT